MAALSDYLESGLLHQVFRGETFPKFENVAIALCSGVPQDSDTGSTIPELPSGKALDGGGNTSTGYKRYSLGKPADSGNIKWQYNIDDHNEGSGLIKNNQVYLFDTALVDWGWVSGLAIVDSGEYGTGNLLMHAQLNNPRVIYQGDSVKFDISTLQISFK